jgi:hypothetical protein
MDECELFFVLEYAILILKMSVFAFTGRDVGFFVFIPSLYQRACSLLNGFYRREQTTDVCTG